MSKAEKSPIQNLIATGLRNPWQFLEFKDYLIIFDTGFTQNEELNITKYETNLFRLRRNSLIILNSYKKRYKTFSNKIKIKIGI